MSEETWARTVYALSESGVWHVTVATYPSSADTACWLAREPSGYFTTRLADTWDRVRFKETSRCRRCWRIKEAASDERARWWNHPPKGGDQ